MALSHRDRFRLKSQLADALITDGQWTQYKTDLLFGEFGLPHTDEQWFAESVTTVLAAASDDALVELYSIVMDVEISEVTDVVESDDVAGIWRSSEVRLFLSHSAHHKAFVADVANELAVVGVHGFVAHDAMAYSKPWQEQIERALRSMQVFVALIHPEFVDSAWCHQEVGWALGRRVPNYVIRVGKDPAGFIGREQWPSAFNKTAKEVADIIYGWVATIPELGSSIIDGLFGALAAAGNYYDAEAAAGRIAALGSLTAADFARLDATWWSNDQAYGGVLPTRKMQPFYESNGRPWPPPKPALPASTQDPWSSQPPF